ncbi:YcaO-like family protein [Ornithinimicrobium sufpigmenti]|uniref:YcaO-like family protein n=1 Tax=Ornithinimicrobium sufpigmenti TaxID=2508882 RepID=UPI001036E2F3|nr:MULTISPECIES: YcaO-like family protein [unclassified Ornithinimicrobium]
MTALAAAPPQPVDALLLTLIRAGRATETSGARTVELFADDSELLLGVPPATEQHGCLDCATLWRQDTSALTPGTGARDWLTTPPWSDLVHALLGHHTRALQGPAATPHTFTTALQTAVTTPVPGATVTVLRRDDATVDSYRFLRHPACLRCGPLADRSTATALDLRSPQPALAGTLRVRPLETERWLERIADPRHGPVPLSYRDERSPLSLVTAEFVAPGSRMREHGYGRASDFAASVGPALLEGIERVLGARRAPGVPIRVASARELGADALDLASIGLHEPEAWESGDLRQWTPDTVTTWVGAWSVGTARPVWVPEQVAYWRAPHGQGRFIYESSNGCAVGGSLEEAALHAYYEVVERDAFLLTWYSRTRLQRIEGIGEDPQVGHLMDLLEAEGLDVQVLDMTTDHEVPTALAVITAPDRLAHEDLFPSLSLASATHADGRQAVRTALEEVATNVLMYRRWTDLRPSVSMRRCRPMLDDFDRVEVLEDHTGLHSLPEARPLNEFLRCSAGVVGMEQFCGSPVADDVAAQLTGHVDRLRALGTDLIVVDQTDDTFTSQVPVHAVKAVVPGAVPMTFGHRHRRLRGLPRLRHAAELLRGGVPWHAAGEIVPTPHPFP